MHCFKEWQIICEALNKGTQSLILRKGGIHEGKDGFSFGSVREFLLFPTRFHAQGDHVKKDGAFTPGKEWESGDAVHFDTFCKVEETYELTDWEQVKALAPFHQWTEACIQERFNWEGKGMASGKIHLALLRAYKLEKPIEIEYTKRLGGCRSWVELEDVTLSGKYTPIISDASFHKVSSATKELLE